MSREIVGSERINTESSFIFLLLNYRSAVSDFLDSQTPIDVFLQEHKPIVNAIIDCFSKYNSLLTRESFREYLNKNKIIKDRILLQSSFNRCFAASENVNNYHVLFQKIIDYFASSRVYQALESFNEKQKNKEETLGSIKKLIYDLEDILDGKYDVNKKGMKYVNIKDSAKKVYDTIKGIRSGEIEVAPPLSTGIKEIDDTMYVGLEEGTLTLFVAEVGTFKSAIMLNIALNVWHQGKDVLFVPLEMTVDQIQRRIYSRESKIDSNYLVAKIKSMTDEQENNMSSTLEDIDNKESNFVLLESYGRTTVSIIKNMIERNIQTFKPRIVVIDYMANLISDINRYGREDLEIGDMLKSLREMGKEYNFAVVSAAQLGKEALKKVRKHSNSSKDRPVNTEDIRGSHEYAADADFIYAMIKNRSQPNELLDLFCVKSRHGKTYFGSDGRVKASLKVWPHFGLIKSADADLFENGKPDEPLMEFIDDSENQRSDIIKKDTLFDEDKIWEIDMGGEAVDDDKDINNNIDDINEITEDDLEEVKSEMEKDKDNIIQNNKIKDYDSSFFDNYE